jgi:hypothetical protein
MIDKNRCHPEGANPASRCTVLTPESNAVAMPETAFKANLEQVLGGQGNDQNHCARPSRRADFASREIRRENVNKRDKSAGQWREITVSRCLTVRNRHELTVS